MIWFDREFRYIISKLEFLGQEMPPVVSMIDWSTKWGGGNLAASW